MISKLAAFGRRLLHVTVCRAAPTPAANIGRVLVSTCHDIYTNLALEDWIYENVDFSDPDSDMLFLWRNSPCIVIGRHQNPWVECSVQSALADGVVVARRRSGGGTVYHDLGNLNCTFFSNRKNYDRKKNLRMIADILRREWNLDVEVSKRDDLLLDNKYKVSGTAAKLGAKVSYHHCTLLLDIDLNNVSKYLQGSLGIASKATASVRSTVKNLCEVQPLLSYQRLVEHLTDTFCASNNSTPTWCYVDPTREATYLGIRQLRTALQQWEWIYGHSPKFQVERTFACNVRGDDVRLSVSLDVDRGHVDSAQIFVVGDGNHGNEVPAKLCKRAGARVKGSRFWPADIARPEEFTTTLVANKMNSESDWTRCLDECLRQVATGK